MKKPKFKGALATKIDFAEPAPFDFESNEGKEWSERRHAAIFKARKDKLFLLAKHPDFEVDYSGLDLSTHTGSMQFYGLMAIRLAVAFGVPGFQLKDRSKEWKAESLVQIVDYGKTTPSGKGKTDFQIALQFVKDSDPEMKRNANRAVAAQRARSLCNRLSAARSAWKRKAEAETRKRAEAERRNTVH
jgi:hypothetical protein